MIYIYIIKSYPEKNALSVHSRYIPLGKFRRNSPFTNNGAIIITMNIDVMDCN